MSADKSNQNKFFIVSTSKLEWLISCVEKGCYGVSQYSFAEKVRTQFREIEKDDLVFLRLLTEHPSEDIVCGPLVVAPPPDYVQFTESHGLWRKVNYQTPPEEYLPNWIIRYPWCFFFDPTLISHMNYCKMYQLGRLSLNLPKWGIIPPETGFSLWENIEDSGHSFADFVQRMGSTVPRSGSIHPEKRFISRRIKSKRGVFVRSKSERMIDDWLFDHDFQAEYERCLVLGGKVITPDFYLTKCGLYIEYLGLLDSNSDYRKDWEWKRKLYDENSIKYITVTEDDIDNLDRNLTVKLKTYLK